MVEHYYISGHILVHTHTTITFFLDRQLAYTNATVLAERSSVSDCGLQSGFLCQWFDYHNRLVHVWLEIWFLKLVMGVISQTNKLITHSTHVTLVDMQPVHREFSLSIWAICQSVSWQISNWLKGVVYRALTHDQGDTAPYRRALGQDKLRQSLLMAAPEMRQALNGQSARVLWYIVRGKCSVVTDRRDYTRVWGHITEYKRDARIWKNGKLQCDIT